MSDELSDVLSSLKSSDVEIDSTGRIVVKDPETSRKLQELATVEPLALGDNNNCNNGCKPLE